MDGIRNTGAGPSFSITVHGQKQNNEAIQEKPIQDAKDGKVDNGLGSGVKLDVVALSNAIASTAGGLKSGESITIGTGSSKEDVITIRKEGANNWEKMGTAVKNFGATAIDISREAIETDPSFVFRQVVEASKEPLTKAAPELIKEMAIKGLYPGVRAGVLFLDAKKAWKTLKDPKASLVDKIVDVGHCITDVAGLAGAAAPLLGLAIPGANVLAAVAIVGDIIAFGYHTLNYIGKKALENQAKKKEAAMPKETKPTLEEIVEKEYEKLPESAKIQNPIPPVPEKRTLENLVNREYE